MIRLRSAWRAIVAAVAPRGWRAGFLRRATHPVRPIDDGVYAERSMGWRIRAHQAGVPVFHESRRIRPEGRPHTKV